MTPSHFEHQKKELNKFYESQLKRLKDEYIRDFCKENKIDIGDTFVVLKGQHQSRQAHLEYITVLGNDVMLHCEVYSHAAQERDKYIFLFEQLKKIN